MYDIIGDFHGCLEEVYLLLDKLGYSREDSGLYRPPDGRIMISVGDVIDRGNYSYQTYLFMKGMVEAGYALWTRGNHDDKFMRWAKGNKVKLLNGLDKTVEHIDPTDKKDIFEFIKNIPYYLSLDGGNLIVIHAAWKPSLGEYDPLNKRCRTWSLFGPTTGKTLENGLPDRIDWVSQRKERDKCIVYGHQPYMDVRVENNTYGIDTGCVFGNKLSCLRWPEKKIIQVKALKEYEINKWWKNV